MTTIILRKDTESGANGIHQMTTQPGNVILRGLHGEQGCRFTCSNDFETIRGAKSVQITYDANHGSRHETIQVSSVQP